MDCIASVIDPFADPARVEEDEGVQDGLIHVRYVPRLYFSHDRGQTVTASAAPILVSLILTSASSSVLVARH
jgi:hypothetical protein